MLILVADCPQNDSYITSLIKAYVEAGHTVICDHNNFFCSNITPDIVHIHWPERLYQWYPLSEKTDEAKIEILNERMKSYKNNGAIIVFTIHDLVLHYSTERQLDEKIFNIVIKHSDIISHHCINSVKLFKSLYPLAESKKNIVNHLNDYSINYKYISKEKARSELNIPLEKFVILNFGSQQPYKGGKFIETVFNKLPIRSKFLLIAGNYYYRGFPLWKKYILEIKNNLREKKVYRDRKYIYRTVNEDEIALIFHASDMVFSGHKAGLNTGLIPFAATYAKPIVYPEIGCFSASAKDWVSIGYEPGNIKQASEALMELYNNLVKDKITLDNSIWMQKNSWNTHVELILQTVNKFKN